MTGEPVRRGLLDTSIMILRSRIAPGELPDEMAISAITLAELSAGLHEVPTRRGQNHFVLNPGPRSGSMFWFRRKTLAGS